MEIIKVGVIGMGNMGSQYARRIALGEVPKLKLAAVTRIRAERYETLKEILDKDLPVFSSAEDLFRACDAGAISLDAVIVATPHPQHEVQVVAAMDRGIHVLCDKPAGITSRQARRMEEKQKDGLVYAYVFQQRTMPIYQNLRELVSNGKYGKLKRISWTVTDWYRPNAYYTSVAWRGTYKTDGGGVLLNQCPHNLDLLQWICGMPLRVQAFCHEGKYHPIEVEDEVTAYMEWNDGATGIFITSTGEAPGVNRLEISLDNALITCEHGALNIQELDQPEVMYRKETENFFAKPQAMQKMVEFQDEESPYVKILSNFADSVANKAAPVAPGEEARNSLLLSNAIYLSSWKKAMVVIPERDTKQEKQFEEEFEQYLHKKQ